LRFTVRRPASAEVSPCCHRPPGGDVACSVDVGVAPTRSAGFALEDRLALAVSGCDMPTSGATLRRVRSRDLLNPAESLVLHPSDELAPATLADRPVEPTLLSHSHPRLLDGAARGAGHRPHVKGLDPDHVEPPCQVSGGLLDPVLTPIPLAGPQLRDRPPRLSAPVGTALAAGQPLLQHLHPLRLTRSQTGCVQQLTGRQRRGHGNTTVNSNHAAIVRAADRVGDTRERDMPTASAIACNPVRLNTLWHRPRQPEPDPPDLGHPYTTEAVVEPLNVIRLHADLPKPFMHTGFTPRGTPMRAVEKVPHGLREIPHRLLLHRLTPSTKPRVLGARLRQLRRLLEITRSIAARLPVLLLLHCQVPHIPRIPAVRQQRRLLLRGRQQSKPRHSRTVTTDTDMSAQSARATLGIGFLPELMARVSCRRRLR
jgi:hypothetical protein